MSPGGTEFIRAMAVIRELLLVSKKDGTAVGSGRGDREEGCSSASEMSSRVKGREPTAPRVPKEKGEGRRLPPGCEPWCYAVGPRASDPGARNRERAQCHQGVWCERRLAS